MAAPNGLIIAWPSTAASIPAGWARVTAMDDRLPKGVSSGEGTTGGSTTHSHTTSGVHNHTATHAHANSTSATASSSELVASGGGQPITPAGHTHDFVYGSEVPTSSDAASGTSSTTSSMPSHLKVIWIQSNGTSDIPNGAVMWLNGTSIPANWDLLDGSPTPDMNNMFLVGASAGGNGGATTSDHDHTYSHGHAAGGSHNSHSITTQADGGGTAGAGAGAFAAPQGHIHATGSTKAMNASTFSLGTDATSSATAAIYPAHTFLYHIKSNAIITTMAANLIGFWNGTKASIPSGWVGCDGTNGTPNLNGSSFPFVRGTTAGGTAGTTGAAALAHTHAYNHNHGNSADHNHGLTGVIGTDTGNALQIGSADSVGASGHGHSPLGTSGNTSSLTVQNTGPSFTSSTPDPAWYAGYFIMRTDQNLVLQAAGVATATLHLSQLIPLVSAGVATAFMSLQPQLTLAAAGSSKATLSFLGGADITPPTDAEIADALAGRYSDVTVRYRFEQRDHHFQFIADLSLAVESCIIELDNTSRGPNRTAVFKLRPANLPVGFDVEYDHITVFAEVLAGGYPTGTAQWVRYALGIFCCDYPEEMHMPNDRQNELWTCKGVDTSIHLLETNTSEIYTVAAGTPYTDAVAVILNDLNLPYAISASARVVPINFSWDVGVTYLEIINDLLINGLNYFPIWPDEYGIFRSRPRGQPWAEPTAVVYSSMWEPRMIRPGFAKRRARARFANRCLVATHDPKRTVQAGLAVNDDPLSRVSTLVKGVITQVDLSGDRSADAQIMSDIAAWTLYDADAMGTTATLQTNPDPRRTAHETYQLFIEDVESGSFWRVNKWRLDTTRPGVTMTHELSRVQPIALELLQVVVPA